MLTKAQLHALILQNLPGNSIQLITPQLLRDVLDDMVDADFNITTNTSNVGLDQYDTGFSYPVGRGVIFEGDIYEANTITTPGTFAPAEWDALTEASQLADYILKDEGIELSAGKTIVNLIDNASLLSLDTGFYQGRGTATTGLDQEYPVTGELMLQIFNGSSATHSMAIAYPFSFDGNIYIRNLNNDWVNINFSDQITTLSNGLTKAGSEGKLGGIFTDVSLDADSENVSPFHINNADLRFANGSTVFTQNGLIGFAIVTDKSINVSATTEVAIASPVIDIATGASQQINLNGEIKAENLQETTELSSTPNLIFTDVDGNFFTGDASLVGGAGGGGTEIGFSNQTFDVVNMTGVATKATNITKATIISIEKNFQATGLTVYIDGYNPSVRTMFGIYDEGGTLITNSLVLSGFNHNTGFVTIPLETSIGLNAGQKYYVAANEINSSLMPYGVVPITSNELFCAAGDLGNDIGVLPGSIAPIITDILSADTLAMYVELVGVLEVAGGSGSGSGEENTASNVGTGEGVFSQKDDVDLQFKSLSAGTNIEISATTDTITITATGNAAGEANTASNVGTGNAGVFKQKTGEDLEFRSFSGNGLMSVSENANEIMISTQAEINLVENTGSGTTIFTGKNGPNLLLRTIGAGPGVAVYSSGDTITLSADTIFNVTEVGTTVTLLESDKGMILLTAGGITVTLPTSPATGTQFVFKDDGYNDADTTTISGGTHTIDGAVARFLINDYNSFTAVFNGSQYSII